MSKLHHKTLESAVVKYGPIQGKTEEEVKAAIAADEKGFTPEQIDEIYNSLEVPGPNDDGKGKSQQEAAEGDKSSKGKRSKEKAFTVVEPFRDISNFAKQYFPGDDVSHFAKDRLKHLLEIGFVEMR